MKTQNFDYASDAINYLIESSQQHEPAQTEPAKDSETQPQTAKAPLPVSSLSIPELESQQLPASLDRELQHFLNGRDSSLIGLNLSNSLIRHPNLYVASTALHDRT